MSDEKYYDEFGTCIACGFFGVDLHHIKTRKSGGSDKAFNLMPLCHKHHVLVHNKGMIEFSRMTFKKHGVNGKAVTEWLCNNSWYVDKFLNKWVNENNSHREAVK